MKKNKPHYLKLYYKWMETGLPHGRGLCMEFYNNPFAADLLEDLTPTEKDFNKLERLGLNQNHWGSDDARGLYGIFTPLRQNIVLLMAALNNEL
jgi:hypothetical protein